MSIDEIFRNANLQNICEFLVNGTGISEPDDRPYGIRLEDAHQKAISKFKECFPNSLDYENATRDLDFYAAELKSIYMEIGFQTGLLIAFQVCGKMIHGSNENDRL